jgi:Zn-dependent M16 (insulinase) family peptidase
MAHLLGLNDLHKDIREKGGAYSAGAAPSDNGTCVLYSFRDPDPNRTYLAFEKGIVNVSKGNFNENDIKEAKIYAFSQVDKIINPSNKGLVYFLRNMTEEEINTFRNRLMNVTREVLDDLVRILLKLQINIL